MKNKEIEELLDYYQKEIDKYEETKQYLMEKYDYDEETIDNISQHQRYRNNKLLLSYIEQLEEDNEYLKRLCETQNNREYRSKFLKEFQEEKGENVYPDYDEIYKRYDSLKEENKQLENNRDKAIEILGNYKHYSTPTEEQNRENEDIVDNAYNILKGDSNEQR